MSTVKRLVIAIDGPAGAGKSTVAKQLARELGLSFLDTGAMYRALALKASRHGLSPSDGEAAAKLGEQTTIEFGEGDPQRVLLDGEDVTALIRTPEMGEFASALSVHPPVRRLLARLQREVVEKGGVTLEGRDTTTVTAFDAPIRVFLTASLEERTSRRHKELAERSLPMDREELKRQIAERDHRDSTRPDSPLVHAEGVVLIDSEGKSAQQIVAEVKAMAEQFLATLPDA